MLFLHKTQEIDKDGDFTLYTRSVYKNVHRGNLYDPEDHIFETSVPHTEFMTLVSRDADFGWYINQPIYKTEVIPPNNYAYNELTNEVIYYVEPDEPERHLLYQKRLFDSEYNKYKCPRNDYYDGHVKIFPKRGH